MKPATVVVAVVAVAALMAVGWCAQNSQDAKARAQADSLMRVTDSLARLDSARSERRKADSLALQILATRAAQLDLARRAAAIRGDSLENQIRIGTDSVLPRALVEDVLRQKNQVIATQAEQLADAAVAAVILTRQRDDAEQSAASWRTAAGEAQRQLEAALKRSRPRFGCTGGLSALAGAGLTAGTGVTVGPTVAAGLGVSCGLVIR